MTSNDRGVDMRAVLFLLGLGLAAPAVAADDTTPWSGEVAATYGRNIGQGLNVGGLVGEVKKNIGGQFALGGRFGGLLGANMSDGGATGYAATPVLVKAEAFPSQARRRPFIGVGLGATFFSAGGVAVAGEGFGTEAAAYGAQGPLFTAMPEIGLDLGGLRIAVQHSFLMGSASSVGASLAVPVGTEISQYDYPSLGTTTFQIGGHFGGPKSGKL